jgi:DNA-binding Xre family transcriptional regulator
MISYGPLKRTLSEMKIELKDLETGNGGVLNKRTVSKLRHNKTVNIESIERVCLFLNVPVEEVVEIKPDCQPR